MNRYVIVGGGVAGTTAALDLRRLDPAAAVTLVGEEPYPYYYRPKLWEYLAGESEQSALFYRPTEWYTAQNILLRLDSKVTSIQPKAHTITIAAGEPLVFDRLLLATGSSCFIPPIPGAALPGVFVLRTLQDAAALRAQASRSRRAVVVGGGLLGLETARALSALHLDVMVVEIAPNLLPRQLDRQGAQFLQKRLESMGLKFITGARTTAVTGESAATGIQLEDGRKVPGELILFSAGIVSRIDLARDAGIEVNQGIIVDASLQTGAADVFAAGDAAEFNGRIYGLIPPAIEQAHAASQNMIGTESIAYRGTLPSATLQLLGMDLTSLGEATMDGPSLTVRRMLDEKAGIYKKIVVRDGVVVGAILLNDSASVPRIKQLIASKQDISKVQDRLLEDAFDLKAFVDNKPVE
jgi:nitrite reductase (NADH) large subunit